MRGIRNYRTLTRARIRWIDHSYLSRFEKYATANEWKKSVWAAYLSALLNGRALDVYDRLSVDVAADYEKLKEALLKNFDMT